MLATNDPAGQAYDGKRFPSEPTPVVVPKSVVDRPVRVQPFESLPPLLVFAVAAIGRLLVVVK
jgi:hypothetical protein